MVGYVYEKLGKPDVAVQYYGKALKLKPQRRDGLEAHGGRQPERLTDG